MMNISDETIGNQIPSEQIYTPTDWAILNHASLERVYRLLANQLSAFELDRAEQLLTAYWQIYRADCLHPQARLGRCTEPTETQLQRMITYLESQGMSEYTPELILQELRSLAQMLRYANANRIM
jgi:hypothetical protein